MINFASNLNKMIEAGLGGPLDPPRTDVAVGHRVVYTEVSGAVASFETNVVAPLKNLRVSMEPIQAGSGDPSPENIRPITGRDAVTVVRTGVNLFDKDNPLVKNGYIDTSTQKIVSSSSHRLIYIPCKPNITYTVSKVAVGSGSSDRLFIGWTKTVPAANVDVYDIHGTSSGFVVGTRYSFTTQTGADAQYVVVWISRSGEYADSIATTQIEVGGTASDYQAYTAESATIQLGDTVYGGTVDVTGGSKTESKQNFTFDGTEAWTIAATGTNRAFRLSNAFSSSIMSANSNTYIANWAIKTTVINNVENSGIDYWAFRTTTVTNNTQLLVITPTANVDMTLEEFKAMLAANPLQIVADLSVTVESSTEPATLSTLHGQNNVWSNSGDVTLEYPYYEETEGY